MDKVVLPIAKKLVEKEMKRGGPYMCFGPQLVLLFFLDQTIEERGVEFGEWRKEMRISASAK